MKYIKLTQKKIAKVDDDDYAELSAYKWRYHSQGYACRWDYSVRPKRMILMHRQIMNTPKGLETDHINHDKLDNRRTNLRIVSSTINGLNASLAKNNTSGFQGVSRAGNRWRAYININRKQISLGCFDTKEDAAIHRLLVKEAACKLTK